MDKKISELTQTNTVFPQDNFVLVQDGETKKVDFTTLKNEVRELGWGRYDDTQYLGATPLQLTDGVKEVLPNNAGNTVEHGSFTFYDSNSQKVLAQNVNDTYMVTVVFKAKSPNANQTHLDIDFYSPVGDFERLRKSLSFFKGNDTEQNFHNVFQYYADSDLVTNGLQIEITSIGGSAEVYDIIYFVQRTQNNG